MANDDSVGCVGCAVLFLVGWIVVANVETVKSIFAHAAPELILAAAATVTWLILRGRQNIICKVVGSLLGPVAIGLILLTLLLIVLNAWRLAASYQMVASVEEFLIALRLAITEAAAVSLPAFIGVIGALIALSSIVPNLRGVTMFVNVKKRIGQFGAVLGVITSFTLFAYVPSGRALDTHYDEMMTRFDAALRREKTAIARAAAANRLSHDLSAASSRERRKIRVALIQLQAVNDDDGGAFPANAAILHARLPPVAPAEPLPRSIPSTRRAYDAARKQADDADARAASAEQAASQAAEGVKAIMREIVAHAVPELEGYAGKFVSKMIDELSERFYAPLVERIITPEPQANLDEVAIEVQNATGKRPLLDIEALARIAGRLDTERKARLASEQQAGESSTTVAFNDRYYVPPLTLLSFDNFNFSPVPVFDPVVRSAPPEYVIGHR